MERFYDCQLTKQFAIDSERDKRTVGTGRKNEVKKTRYTAFDAIKIKTEQLKRIRTIKSIARQVIAGIIALALWPVFSRTLRHHFYFFHQIILLLANISL